MIWIYSPVMEIRDEILKLKKEKNAVILAHNYQIPEIQDIADFVGDSLDLSKKARDTDADVMVFCGVKFMAETAKILSPEKTVLLPEKDAGCPMADMVTPQDVLDLRKKYPDATFVAYVNTNADVKALVDVCCTSANAIKVVNGINAGRIVFLPDKNLGKWVQRHTDKEIIIWHGFCPTHHSFITPEDIKHLKKEHPDALVMVHPECTPEVIDLADEVASTNGMVHIARESNKKEFIVGTEEGLAYRLKKENPEKEFYPIKRAICSGMKTITLDSLLNSLKYNQFGIKLSDEIIKRSRNALNRMLEF